MSIEEENKARQRRVWEEIWNGHNYDLIPELISENWVEHTPRVEVEGQEGFKQAIVASLPSFPDMHAKIEDMFAEGNKVTTRFTVTGTFTGEYMGIAPTGNKFKFWGINHTHWENGKQVEAWAAWDTSFLFQQLGSNLPSHK